MSKTKKCVISLDVGGTNIGFGILNEDLEVVGAFGSVESNSGSSQEVILSSFNAVIARLVKLVEQNNFTAAACSIAFPDPFDYKTGTPLMKQKFQALYGLDMRSALQTKHHVPILFLNDAVAFGYGVRDKYFADSPEKLVAITLGTGLGAAFSSGGAVTNLSIWDAVYQAGILEDYISARMITSAYKNATGQSQTVEHIAELALKGNAAAMKVFEEFGNNIGEGLAATTAELSPGVIVCGGAISKSFKLFGEIAQHAFQQKTGQSVKFQAVEDPHTSLFGAAAYAFETLSS